MSIRQDVLDGTLLDKFKKAMTPDRVEYLVTATNQAVKDLQGTTPHELETPADEQRRLDLALSNLVNFVAKGHVTSTRPGGPSCAHRSHTCGDQIVS
jgi:hypothetical protein